MIGCILNPIACATDALSGLPWNAILASLIVGLVLGAAIGWRGFAIIATVGVALFFMYRQKPDEPAHEHVGGRDAAPAPGKPRQKPASRQSEWFRKATGQD